MLLKLRLPFTSCIEISRIILHLILFPYIEGGILHFPLLQHFLDVQVNIVSRGILVKAFFDGRDRLRHELQHVFQSLGK